MMIRVNSKKSLPSGWMYSSIGDVIAEISDGGTPPREDTANFGDEIPWLVVDDIRPEIITTREALSRKGYKRCNAKIWPPGSIILSFGATIGCVGIAQINLCTKQGIAGIVLKKGNNEKYFYYALKIKQHDLLRYANGTTIKEIRPESIRKYIKVLYPESYIEQSKIAEILSACDEAINKTDAKIEKLKKIKQGLMQDLFRYGIDEKGQIRSELTHRFKDSPLGRIPEEWEVKEMGKIVTLQRGFDLPIQDRKEGAVPVFGSNGIDGWHDKARVQGPGVITGRSGTIGAVYYYENDYWPLNTTLYIKEFHGNDKMYIFRFLSHIDLKQFSIATGVPTLNRNFVHPTLSFLPSVFEQRQIAEVLAVADKAISKEEAYKQKLLLLKAGLMEDLLSGTVRVNHLIREAS